MAGGGRRKRASQKKNQKSSSRQPAKDHSLTHSQNESPLAEELTALSSIFQEDFTLISEDAFTEFSIALRAHADGGRSNVSAELHVRYLPGYPYKPPKLQVKCMEGLTDDELQLLHSLLIDQASAISREGRVMVYNLVEAAQEFLSEHVESEPLQKVEETSSIEGDLHTTVSNNAVCGFEDSKGPLVFGFVDLFNELKDEGLWTGDPQQIQQKGLEMRTGNALLRSLFPAEDSSLLAMKRASQKLQSASLDARVVEQHLPRRISNKHPSPEEEAAGIDSGKAIQFSSVSELLEKVYCGSNLKNPVSSEQSSASLTSSTSESVSEMKCFDVQGIQFAHLLRLVCCPRGPLPHAWSAIASQLKKIDVIPRKIIDLSMNQPKNFQLAFREIFADSIKEATDFARGPSSTTSFWTASEELLGDEDSIRTKNSSRYASDFEELSVLGKGGFGYVVLCKNKLDGRHYAMKKIRLTDRSPSLNNKILREVTTLSRLQHHHIVRYYQAWFGTVAGIIQLVSEVETSGEIDMTGSSFKPLAVKGSVFDPAEDNYVERTYLYIQMEYCPRLYLFLSSLKPVILSHLKVAILCLRYYGGSL